ncbi:MAG TPA: NAD-dependent epimerase/dehydratase family protein [Nitrospirota bacterium]|nr:NAD-dependent epimerase/dehydratase family protein [Nitrospirota bacterium]
MQTILGSGGAIGVELAKALKTYTSSIRLVSRNPKAVNPDDQLLSADLTKSEDALKAVDGSEIVYLCVGLPYNTKIWEQAWPIIMQNVIDACKAHNSKLVFIDNVYMYDRHHMPWMTEDTPVCPKTYKGFVRYGIAKMILDEVAKKDLQALIARSADFYGPSIRNSSILTEMVFKKLGRGKAAAWLGSAKYRHSFTYTVDAGQAAALLGNTPDAYNQVWHLPTAGDPFTGKQWIEVIANELGIEPRYHVVTKLMVRILGLFNPLMKEMVEMMYQYKQEYVFTSGKFEKKFRMKPTPYLEGIKEIVKKGF